MISRNGEFWISRVLVVCACAFLVYSFLALERRTTPTELEEDTQDISSSPRLVFMVIDAFRLSFLTSQESPMPFIKSQMSKKSAKLFDAYARMPTVTLPRITAYITGTLPSFGTILTNLATEEIKVDNWVSRLHKTNKKVHFFGDDTWIRLLPGKFAKFEGVTSFFVNDYTEVDHNVTRHLDTEYSESREKWDVLILHYLGLDHIGHSLGGESSKIPEKLREMDDIIEKTYEYLSKTATGSQESFFIVCGDHGMTKMGSHGGASPEETRVPVVIWKIGGSRENTDENVESNHENLVQIEQIDVSSTIFDIFNLKIPSKSYGISLINHFRGDSHQTELFEKQRKHFINIIKEKDLPVSDICDEDCDYSNTFIRSSLRKWFREVQQAVIKSSSEVPDVWLGACIFLLLNSLILSFCAWNWKRQSKLNLSMFLVSFIGFASSLVEEEHEIWYYMGSTVVVLRAFQSVRRRKKEEFKSTLLLGLLHRLAFGYMQGTRRRWSMDPALLPASRFSSFLDLKVYDLNEIMNCNIPLTISLNVLLWLCFYKGSLIQVILPIIVHALRYFEFHSLYVPLIFFLQLAILLISYSTGCVFNGCLPLILSICPSSQISLLLLVYKIGELSTKLKFRSLENAILCMSSYFYLGNSNSLSTLSLTSAYVGLAEYQPFFVGLQLLLYTYAGSIIFICGKKSSTTWLNALFSYRICSLIISLSCLFFFQHHLFLWSVYSPKVVYDMTHTIFFSFM